MKKKILCIVQLPPPIHGVSIMNDCLLSSQLLNKSFDIKAIDLKFGKSIKELQRFTFKKVYKSIFFAVQIAKDILIFKPCLVYFTISPTGFAFYRDAYYILLIKLLFRGKILIHLHGKGIEKEIINSRIKKKIYKTVFKQTHIICLSTLLSNDIKNTYKGQPYIIPNGIKSHLKKGFVTNRSMNSTPQILYLSNFIKNKGILILLDALQIVKSNGCSFRAKFVGAPSDITNSILHKKIYDLNLNKNVEVIGPLIGDAKFKAYKEADVFVFPTYNDAFPLVTLEAMQFSLPIISTFEGSIPDIVVNNVTGFLVEKENHFQLAEKIEILLNDYDLRVRMGNKGYERYLENYTFKHFESNMLRTFQKIISE